MTPVDVVDAIVTTLTDAFPGWGVERYIGPLSEDEVPALLPKMPIFLVSVLRITDFVPHGHQQFRGTLPLKIYVLGVEQQESHAFLVLSTAHSLLTKLPGQRWGLADARPPDSTTLAADNLETVRANGLRVSLWTVSWDQTFTFTFS